MIRIRHVFLFALLFTLALGGEMIKEISFPQTLLSLTSKDGYTIVNYGNAPEIDAQPGSPSLPVSPVHIVLPPDAELEGVEVISVEEKRIPGEYLLYPVQPGRTFSDLKPHPFVPPRDEFYNLSTFYPERIVDFVGTGNKGGFRLCRFLVFPVRYLPARRELYLAEKVKVRIIYNEGRIPPKPISPFKLSLFSSDVSDLVINPEDVAKFAPPVRTTPTFSPNLPPGYYEYVIITPQVYRDSCEPLRYWRQKLGYPARIMTIEEIQQTYPGRDLPEKMRNFIKDADSVWQTVFFFIVRQDAPAQQYRLLRVRYTSNEDLPGDIYFSDLDGTWDFNNNNIFGEPADSIDGYSDVYVGMMTTESFQEIRTYLNKLFRYEKTPDSTYFKKVLLPVAVSFSMEFNDSIANAVPADWFSCKMYYTGSGISPQRFTDSINVGYAYTSVIAHGTPRTMELNGSWTGTMARNLTNTNKLNILTAVCCDPGSFDLYNDCLAETITGVAQNGFAAVMMNARSGWVRVAEYYNYHFFYKFLPRMPIGRHPLCSAYVYVGQALAHSKDQLRPLWPMTDSSRFRWEAYERNLFGDPAIPMNVDNPHHLNVQFPQAINIGSNVPVPVTVSYQSNPICSALVCLWMGENVYAKGRTNSSGQLTLYVSPNQVGSMLITVSARNYFPFEDSIRIVSTGRYVSYLKHLIDDAPPRGNGDGIPNPGEELELPTWVKNWGNLSAQNVIGRFFTRDPQAQSSDTLKTFGNIGPQDSAFTGNNGYNLRINTGLGNGYAILCTLICKDNLDSSWVSRFTITVGTPVFSFQNYLVSDSHCSRPNGRIDPGENPFLQVAIRNVGLGHGYNCQAKLKAYDTLFIVLDSLANYGFIPKDSVGVNSSDRFQVFADPRMRPETQVPCTLFITADGGYSQKIGFRVGVGVLTITDPIPDGDPAIYYAYDDIDTLYRQRPVYRWIELRNRGTQLPITLDDQTIRIPLPFVFKYYGIRYTDSLSVCSNGWISPIRTTATVYTNQPLPDPTPGNPHAMICPNWDDLYPPYGNRIWYLYEPDSHRFVIEWDSVHYFSPNTLWDKFEVIVFDTTVPTPTGDNRFVFQYYSANNYTSNTIGFEDHTSTRGINCVYNGSYHRAQAPLVAGRAIAFHTGEPEVGILEKEISQFNPLKGNLRVYPTILRDNTLKIEYLIAGKEGKKVTLYDVSGKKVREITLKSGTQTLEMKNLPSGIYFLRLKEGKEKSDYKVLLLK